VLLFLGVVTGINFNQFNWTKCGEGNLFDLDVFVYRLVRVCSGYDV
jgi:hypothetical protein